MRFAFSLAAFVVFAASSACVVAPQAGVHSATPVDGAIGAGLAARELANAPGERLELGWGLAVAGDRAHFYECTTPTDCTFRRVELPAARLRGMKTIGRTAPLRDNGERAAECDVLRIAVDADVKTTRGGAAIDPNRGVTTVGGAP